MVPSSFTGVVSSCFQLSTLSSPIASVNFSKWALLMWNCFLASTSFRLRYSAELNYAFQVDSLEFGPTTYRVSLFAGSSIRCRNTIASHVDVQHSFLVCLDPRGCPPPTRFRCVRRVFCPRCRRSRMRTHICNLRYDRVRVVLAHGTSCSPLHLCKTGSVCQSAIRPFYCIGKLCRNCKRSPGISRTRWGPVEVQNRCTRSWLPVNSYRSIEKLRLLTFPLSSDLL